VTPRPTWPEIERRKTPGTRRDRRPGWRQWAFLAGLLVLAVVKTVFFPD